MSNGLRLRLYIMQTLPELVQLTTILSLCPQVQYRFDHSTA